MTDLASQFYAILTNIGLAKQANADALGISWKITHMAVGDANGTDPQPSATQTRLINEVRRAPLNQLKVDPANEAVVIAEQVIPADVGGWWIRELALFDEAGDMVAVANCPPSFKPLLAQGSGRTQVVRMNLVVSNVGNVELKIDPSVVLATRSWVSDIIEALKKQLVQATEAVIGLAKIASQSQVNSGADDTTIVTPKKLRLGFCVSLSEIGYIALPTWMGGLIFQWGVVYDVGQASHTGNTPGPTKTITLPITFPRETYVAIASMHFNTMSTTSAFAPGAVFLSKSQISVQNNYTSSAGNLVWLAIGK